MTSTENNTDHDFWQLHIAQWQASVWVMQVKMNSETLVNKKAQPADIKDMPVCWHKGKTRGQHIVKLGYFKSGIFYAWSRMSFSF